MLLHSLETTSFRNLSGVLLPLTPGINLLYGSNAAGKTNTLEAVYLFASGKSFRTSHEKDLIRHGSEFARARLLFESAGLERDLSVTYLSSGIKQMCICSNPVDRVSEFLGIFRAVLFTPDDLALVKGSPEERRRLIDSALCQIKPRYVKSLNDFGKLLEQRNSYLRERKYTGRRVDADYLDVLSRQLACAGGVIVKQRGAFASKLSEYASDAYTKLTNEREALFIKYVTASRLADTSDEARNEKALYDIYKATTQRDIDLGRTYSGPQRDDLAIFVAKNIDELDGDIELAKEKNINLGEFAARTFGSQGQQRSAVLALKLSESEIMKELTGEYPLLLLDDLFSELDEGRKTRLSEMFGSRQCLITCCDTSFVPHGLDINMIQVENGKYGENNAE